MPLLQISKKFYNLGDKTFETDFSLLMEHVLSIQCILYTVYLERRGDCL